MKLVWQGKVKPPAGLSLLAGLVVFNGGGCVEVVLASPVSGSEKAYGDPTDVHLPDILTRRQQCLASTKHLGHGALVQPADLVMGVSAVSWSSLTNWVRGICCDRSVCWA